MPGDSVDLFHKFLHFFREQWELFAFGFGAALGGLLWAWRQYVRVFASAESVRQLDKRNTTQHNDIVKDINAKHGEMIQKISDVEARILRTIIDVGSHEK